MYLIALVWILFNFVNIGKIEKDFNKAYRSNITDNRQNTNKCSNTHDECLNMVQKEKTRRITDKTICLVFFS
jgi:hypothetical protein